MKVELVREIFRACVFSASPYPKCGTFRVMSSSCSQKLLKTLNGRNVLCEGGSRDGRGRVRRWALREAAQQASHARPCRVKHALFRWIKLTKIGLCLYDLKRKCGYL